MHKYTVSVVWAGVATWCKAGRAGAAGATPIKANSRVRVGRSCFIPKAKLSFTRLDNFIVPT
jgi:hypothetical protein